MNRAQDTIPIRVPLPTASDAAPGDAAAAAADKREEEEEEDEGGVYHLAYHSAQSYGAAPYLICLPRGRRRRKQINVMVDSPRWSAPLADRLEEMGGVHAIFLTHKDDVAGLYKSNTVDPELDKLESAWVSNVEPVM